MYRITLTNGPNISIYVDELTVNRDSRKILHVVFILKDNTVVSCINIRDIDTIKHLYDFKDLIK